MEDIKEVAIVLGLVVLAVVVILFASSGVRLWESKVKKDAMEQDVRRIGREVQIEIERRRTQPSQP